MLPKSKRFTRENFPKGRPAERRSFSWGTVSIYPNITPHFGVIISKKVLKKAHDRNRARRRIYTSLSKLAPKSAMLIYLRMEALTTPLAQIENDIQGLSS